MVLGEAEIREDIVIRNKKDVYDINRIYSCEIMHLFLYIFIERYMKS